MRKKLILMTYTLIVCVALTSKVKGQETIMAIYPKTCTVNTPGETFQINLTITNTPPIVQWMARVRWNPDILRFVKVEEGPFMKDIGNTMFLVKPVNQTEGIIPEMTCLFMEIAEAEGNGTIAIITFNGTTVGESYITIYESVLLDAEGATIPHAVENGTVTVIPEFPVSTIVPLFLILTTTITVIAKIVLSRKRPRIP